MERFQTILEEERQTLKRLLRQKKSLLNILPKGSLSVRKHGKHSYLYWVRYKKVDGGFKKIQTVLHEKDRHLLQQLRRRKLIQAQIPLIEENLRRLEHLLDHYRPYEDQSVTSEFTTPYQETYDYRGFAETKLNMTTSSGAFHPEHLIHKNSVGELFRSKGEVQISELLRNRKIPYQYESKLNINGKWLLPDFTFQLPGSDRTVYLELCGMLDKDDYFENTIRKIQIFLNNGYVSGRDVLFLLESKSTGSDLATTIRQLDYFLTQ